MQLKKNILFVVPYPLGKAPSQRFRFEQYFDILKEAGFSYQVASFLDDATWEILYKPGHTFKKITGTIKGFGHRFLLLFRASKFDLIFIHREATPVGPPWVEWILARILKKKIIYDFDDAIWIPSTSANNKLVAGLRWSQKVGQICRWATKVSCGNSYLQAYAGKFNSHAIVNPTTIDTINHHNKLKVQNTSKVVIGWTGTHSTLKYLEMILPVLQNLEEKYAFEFLVISNKPPEFDLRSLVYKPWQKETEIEDLLKFNVGLMPLEDDPWAKGKCAFKALQYMSLGIPPVVSPIGMNVEVVENGNNGYVCSSPEEWYYHLEQLIVDSVLRAKLGTAAKEKVDKCYAVVANRTNFLGLFTK
ncbi:glycosyltransferase [Adhaeribacter rhizoryzae]|uniref:Glycosyltransferase family 4 protein n=1 Tax=Adhaeribacter rhizoryzae TaxID=2607907 RepID=A0A5M6DL96_9BACT|nr:glycosyltransferase [Adhaeribacter rhizoryzae]KAA5548311.1 glycosyltransferase family 4 protein [Adhaeribacter rhizoryzae]